MGRTLSFGPGAVAQLGERRLCTAEVRGSNPLGSTLKKVIIPSEQVAAQTK